MSNRPFDLVQRTDVLRELCEGRSVLHLGCTNWPYFEESAQLEKYLHSMLLGHAAEAWGVDSDHEGIEALRKKGVGNLHIGDLERLEELPFARSFDLIVAGEVVEHLSNPGLMLSGVKRFMGAETRLVVTTINSYCAFRFAVYGLRGRGGLAEPVHPDHVAYYSYRTLHLLAQRAGLELDRFMFYDVGREHRPNMRRSVRLINDVAVRFMPQLADGIIGIFKLPGADAQEANSSS